MPSLYQPKYKITINGFDVSSTIAPYLISIDLEDTFDSNFTVSKLELTFHAKYKRSVNWQYKDQLKLELWWLPFPVFKFVSNTFYVDYIEDVKNQGGLQTFRVSALEADPTLGFNYGAGEITLSNITTKQAVLDFKNKFGLTLTENMTSDVYMGVVRNVTDTTSSADLNTVKASFDSYADMLKYICNTFGYFGNISGKNLQIILGESTYSENSRFTVWSFEEVYSFEVKQTYNNISKQYNCFYVNHPTNNDLIQKYLQPQMQEQLNNKTKNLEINDAYYNSATADERLYGEMYREFYDGFETRIECSAQPEFKAGNVFLLDSTYGNHEGLYRCTRVRHRVDSNGWNAEVIGFPIAVLKSVTATFDVGYVGRYQNPPASNTISLSRKISGTTTGLTGAMLDNYAKYYNPNYNLNLGAIFITEGNKTGNAIKPDIAFCLALVETLNFTNNELVTKKNPGGVGSAASGGAVAASFADWNTGIRAEIQRLFAFAKSTGSPADAIVDPRYSSVTRGVAPKIDDLTNLWNANLDFGSQIEEKLRQLYIFINPLINVKFID